MAPIVRPSFPHCPQNRSSTWNNSMSTDREYIKLDFPTEDIEEYREGGFQPIRVGSIFRGRYFIRGKIGYGGCGTVWWAKDTVQERHVAVKIISSHASKRFSPMQTFYYHDDDLAPNHPGRNSIVKLIRTFWHRGPNGNHLCLVLELAGPRIESYMKYRPNGSFSLIETQKLALNTTMALGYLHAERYVHGDFTPSNVFVRITNPRDWTPSQLEVIDVLRASVSSEPLIRIDGETAHPRGPRTITSPMQLWKLDPECFTTNIIVGDLDASFPYEDAPERNFILPPLHYCAPELLTQLVPTPPNLQTDIWSLGLTLFVIRAGTLLFPRTRDTNKMFLSLHIRLGDSAKLREMWTTKEEFVNDDGTIMVYTPIQKSLREAIEDIGRDIEETAGSETETQISAEDAGSNVALKSLADEWVPPRPSPAEVDCFHDLLSRMLYVEPEKRITIGEVAKHPWFTTEFDRNIYAISINDFHDPITQTY